MSVFRKKHRTFVFGFLLDRNASVDLQVSHCDVPAGVFFLSSVLVLCYK